MNATCISKLIQAASLVVILLAACSGGTLPSPTPAATSPATSPATTANQSQSQPTPTPAQPASSPATQPANACTSPAPLTDALTEGPYFKAGSPERASLLEPGMSGTKLVLTGYVLTVDCKPIAHALLDFWQADASGQYDNTGYTLRGHQFSDAQGRYHLETVVPGLYPGRTEHIHVKVQAPNGPLLTTQLFFPGVTSNDSDSIYDPTMVISMQETADGESGTFNFIVSAP